jgi:hypothetical protein
MKKELKRFRLYKSKKVIASFDTYQEACNYAERLPVGQLVKCSIEDSNYFPVKKDIK